MVIRPVVHMLLHIVVPGLISHRFYPGLFFRSWLILLTALLIDVDHFLATPVYQADRCSIGFHPFHSYWAISIYLILVLFPKIRILGIGLIIHIILDGLDCFWMNYI